MEDDEMGIETWMPVYTRDMLASCSGMSPSQFGGYMRLLLYAWDSGGVPNDMEECCRIAGGLSPADWQAIRRRLVVLDAGTSEERLSHPRLEREREKQQAGYARKVSAIAKAREAKRSVDNPDDNHVNRDVVNHVDMPVNNPVNRREPEPEPEPEPDTLKSGRRRTPRARRTPTTPLPAIAWTAAGGFTGITDAHREAWKVAYPLVNIDRACAKAHANLLVTTKRYTSIGRYLTNWLKGDQEMAELGHHTAAPQKSFRPDAGQAMTASEYADWKRARDRDEYLKAKARKRGGGLTSIGEVIDERQVE